MITANIAVVKQSTEYKFLENVYDLECPFTVIEGQSEKGKKLTGKCVRQCFMCKMTFSQLFCVFHLTTVLTPFVIMASRSPVR